MAKRLTDSRKWDDPFWIDLDNNYKVLWIYLLDKCDHAGIYKHSTKLLKFNVPNIDWKDALKLFGKRIQHLKEDKYFIPKFIDFQYGELIPNSNKLHTSVISLLEKEGAYKGLTRGLQAPKNKSKNKDKDKDKDKDNKEKYLDFVFLDKEEYKKLVTKIGLKQTELYIEKLNNYIGSKGKKYASHYFTILNWSVKETENNKKGDKNGYDKISNAVGTAKTGKYDNVGTVG